MTAQLLTAGLLREHHDEVARFMAAMQPEGAAQAAQLSGLSLQAGLALAMQRRQYTECGPEICTPHTKHDPTQLGKQDLYPITALGSPIA